MKHSIWRMAFAAVLTLVGVTPGRAHAVTCPSPARLVFVNSNSPMDFSNANPNVGDQVTVTMHTERTDTNNDSVTLNCDIEFHDQNGQKVIDPNVIDPAQMFASAQFGPSGQTDCSRQFTMKHAGSFTVFGGIIPNGQPGQQCDAIVWTLQSAGTIQVMNQNSGGFCGDGHCDSGTGETCSSCPADCGACGGNNQCNCLTCVIDPNSSCNCATVCPNGGNCGDCSNCQPGPNCNCALACTGGGGFCIGTSNFCADSCPNLLHIDRDTALRNCRNALQQEGARIGNRRRFCLDQIFWCQARCLQPNDGSHDFDDNVVFCFDVCPANLQSTAAANADCQTNMQSNSPFGDASLLKKFCPKRVLLCQHECIPDPTVGTQP